MIRLPATPKLLMTSAPDGILLAVHRDKARSGADAALEVHTYHAGAAADGALCKDAVCAADGAMHIVLGEMAAADVVQLAVIASNYHAVDGYRW